MRFLTNEEEKEAIKWMNEAAKIAELALCFRAKCGTVIVGSGAVIGRGYNAPPRDDPKNRICLNEYQFREKKPKYDLTCCMHAEWRAILDALKRNGEKVKDARLYFIRVDQDGNIKKSGQPYCTVCSRMALDVGIAEFLLWHEEGICAYPTDEYDRLSYSYVKEKE